MLLYQQLKLINIHSHFQDHEHVNGNNLTKLRHKISNFFFYLVFHSSYNVDKAGKQCVPPSKQFIFSHIFQCLLDPINTSCYIPASHNIFTKLYNINQWNALFSLLYRARWLRCKNNNNQLLALVSICYRDKI